MIEYLRQHLGAKLFLSYLFVILVGAIVLLLTARLTTPTAYNRHLGLLEQGLAESESIDEDGRGGGGLRRGQGSGYASELYTSFQESFSEAMTWAAIAAGAVALAVSLYLSQRVVRPIRAMTTASQHIAAGNYDERVQEDSDDELGHLAASFNQMTSQLQQVESMRRQLIGDVAHELRTPLTAIKGSMEALLDKKLPDSDETYQQIYLEADRLNSLVYDLQELSRVEAGAYDLQIQPMELASLTKILAKRFDHQFEEKQVRLTIELPADLPPVLADEERVLQVLSNLISNALRYTPSDGEVTLSSTLRGNQVHTTVKDTGIGIPHEHLPHIFTRFYRVDKSRSRQAGGSGIGLTIARHLVESHGGHIWVESAGDDKGSAFTFTLPIAVRTLPSAL
jgi:histidine kinase